MNTPNFIERVSNYYDQHTSSIHLITLSMIAIFGLIVQIAVAGLFTEPKSHLEKEDIYFVWLAGKDIFDGTNPYDSVLDGNLVVNEKYATYLPFFYLLAYLMQLLGFTSFEEWIYLICILSVLAYLGIAYLLYFSFRGRSYPFAIFATVYWMFNRWTIVVIFVVHIDFIALFFLLLALLHYENHRDLALLSLGLSLTMKQMAIFLIPLFAIKMYHDLEIQSRKQYAEAWLKIGIIPLTFSLPFMILNFKSFLYSMLFNLTRVPAGITDEYWDATQNGDWIAFGLLNRLFMILVMVLLYVLYFQKRIGIITSSFLVFVTFIEFNLTLFDQYRVWRVALLPLIFLEIHIFRIKWEIDTKSIV